MKEGAIATRVAEPPDDGGWAKDEKVDIGAEMGCIEETKGATATAGGKSNATTTGGGGARGRERVDGQPPQEKAKFAGVVVEDGPLRWSTGRSTNAHSNSNDLRSLMLGSATSWGETPTASSSFSASRLDSPRPITWSTLLAGRLDNPLPGLGYFLRHTPGSSISNSSNSDIGIGSGSGSGSIVGDAEMCSEEGGLSSGAGGDEASGAAAAHAVYQCQVCLEDRPLTAGYPLSACQHIFCRKCLKSYVKSKVSDGQVYPPCFFVLENDQEAQATSACGVTISREDIDVLLRSDPKTRRKYTRFLFCRENKHARECPRCSYLQEGDPKVVEMRCRKCRQVYCYEHGGAHEGKTCVEHVEATAEENDRTLALIGAMKRCPSCQTPVEKLGGCNQMVCYHCDSSFCWICGAEVDRGTFPTHFQWWNVNGCPNQQLQEDAPDAGRGRQCHRFLAVLQVIIVGPLAFILTVTSSALCACCLPAFNLPPRELFMECFSGWGNLIMLLPFLPFVLIALVVLMIYYVILLPFRIALVLRRKYRQRRQHGIDMSSNAGISATLDHPASNPSRPPAQQIRSNSALGAGAGRNSTAGDISVTNETSVTRQVTPAAAGVEGAETPTSQSSPFAATLGYAPRDFSRRELAAITEQRQQHLQRLHALPSSWGNDRSRLYDSGKLTYAGVSASSGDGDTSAATSLSAGEAKGGESRGGAGRHAEQPAGGDITSSATNIASVRGMMGNLFGASPVSTAAAAAVAAAAMPTVGSGRSLGSLSESRSVDEV